MLEQPIYPIGIQTFSEIVNKGMLYVDKTDYVYRIAHSKKYVFLSRPRRFGKSLLVSTLKAYFEGQKDLFKGLAMEKLEDKWENYPVLHISLASSKLGDKDLLQNDLMLKLSLYEDLYGHDEGAKLPGQKLFSLVKRAYEKTGRQVVVLIDEYDAPLLDVADDEVKFKELRKALQNFYSPLKDLDPYLRFVFLTGITKFSQLSIFSELNNLKLVSMDPDYAGICGITQEELETQMAGSVESFAKKNGINVQQALTLLKDNYDGYHFSWPSPDIYNPFSLLNAFDDGKVGSFWFANTPSYLVNMLRSYNVLPSELGDSWTATNDDFDVPTDGMTDMAPLLYQSGYITIKDYDEETDLYTLSIPNREIKIGLFRGLLPGYLGSNTRLANSNAKLMQVALIRDDVDKMLSLLQTYLGSIPQTDNIHKPDVYEGHWQQMLYLLFSLLGASVDVEVRTPDGRVDVVARTLRKLYLFELKLNATANAALNQINLNDYPQRFALSGLPVVKVGISFSASKHNITGWKIEE